MGHKIREPATSERGCMMNSGFLYLKRGIRTNSSNWACVSPYDLSLGLVRNGESTRRLYWMLLARVGGNSAYSGQFRGPGVPLSRWRQKHSGVSLLGRPSQKGGEGVRK